MIAVGVKNKMKEARCKEIIKEVRDNCDDLLLADCFSRDLVIFN